MPSFELDHNWPDISKPLGLLEELTAVLICFLYYNQPVGSRDKE